MMRTVHTGGPAPLYVNPGQIHAGLLALSMSALMVLSVIGVAVNKISDEICQSLFVSMFALTAFVSFALSTLFALMSMKRLGSDSEWFFLNIGISFLSFALAFCGSWGVILLVDASTAFSVKQCFECADSNGNTRATDDTCRVGDTCVETSYAYISSESDCPGGSKGGNSSIDCEVHFLCQKLAPQTFAVGAVITTFTLIASVSVAYFSFIKFMPFYVIQQRQSSRFK